MFLRYVHLRHFLWLAHDSELLIRQHGSGMHPSKVSVRCPPERKLKLVENILFELPYDEERYQKTLEVSLK